MPTLERLVTGRHRVAVVVSQPDRPRGRGRKHSASPVAEFALREEIPLLRPEAVGTPEVASSLRAFEPDLGVVVAFGQFLPRRIREAPALGYLLNGHASLLPKLRGAAPIARAILDGETETGITVMRVEREMDTGPTAGAWSTAIGPEETCGELAERLADLTATAIEETVEQAAEGTVHFAEQDHERATFAPKLERADARLDWHHPAAALVRRVRAMSPRPGAFTSLEGKPLRILAARAETDVASGVPGTLRMLAASRLRIATGEGWLVPLVMQRAGGRALAVEEFARGAGLRDGVRLGGESSAATLRA